MSNSAVVGQGNGEKREPFLICSCPHLTEEQGGIYKRIIDAVVEVARTDFEENGVPSDVLQLLQDVSHFLRRLYTASCLRVDMNVCERRNQSQKCSVVNV